MAYEFKLPDIGEGVVEGEIVEWLVSEGESVAEDQPLVAVMTDKATVEIPSPRAGTVIALGAPAGEVVKVGSVLLTIDAGESGAEAATPAPEGAKPEPPAKSETVAPAAERKKPSRSEPAAGPRPAPAPTPPPPSGGRSKVLASPATRKLARELGVDLSAVSGSGPRGRVQASDVEAAAARPAGPAAAPVQAREAAAAPLAIPRHAVGEPTREEEVIPLRGLRKIIAERMVESKTTAPHFSYVDECDVTDLVALRERLKPAAERYGVKLTYLPFIVKALVPALREFPLVNASIDQAAGEITLKKYYNIGIATDTPQGLNVPVVKDVDRKSILEIAAEINELTSRARAQRASMEDLTGGTFTITSTGNIGGLFATPIINQPEVAILGVPKIRKMPVVRDGQVVVRDMLWPALSLDHRVVDGAVGARFLNALIGTLSRPETLLLELA